MLISEDGGRVVQSRLYLVSWPGMRGSLFEGMATPVGELKDTLDW